jgi:hypothetical protein
MAINTSEAFARLRSRRNPEDRQIQEVYNQIQEDQSVQYLIGAMQPVEVGYTQNTIAEADRVFNQVEQGLLVHGVRLWKDYQGSVTKNTHILAHSDIDLLVVHGHFEDLQPPQVLNDPYLGDPLADLLFVRSTTTAKLRSAFYTANVDDTKPKCVRISGGSLQRCVDVVPCNWWRTNDFQSSGGNKIYAGFAILDKSIPSREHEQPFIHGAFLEAKDNRTFGNTKALIRLLKSLKYDSDGRCDISSYDIEGIVYHMPDDKMHASIGDEILLALACRDWLASLEENSTLRNGLDVPDGKRKIFAAGKTTVAQLSALRSELHGLLEDIEKSLRTSSRQLNEAKVHWPRAVKQTPWYVAPQR